MPLQLSSSLFVSSALHASLITPSSHNASRTDIGKAPPPPSGGGNVTLQTVPPPPPAAPPPGSALPPGWQAVKDQNSGQVYYYNSQTGATSWNNPASAV
mmetsp:Transcript_18152/g.36601  ORF Transcript_18152/g.36601 Transcript_18152/m.36601 type:complete len:99 (-) Transcript_18152:462-758(-)